MNDSIMVSGGRGPSTSDKSTVAKFKDDVWTQLGNLNEARHQHNSIIFNSDILIVGGYGR